MGSHIPPCDFIADVDSEQNVGGTNEVDEGIVMQVILEVSKTKRTPFVSSTLIQGKLDRSENVII